MSDRFSPKEFLRSRRPERFSDSVRKEESVLNRSTLEYHLDTLTSRNQETDFERFALALVRKVICPNLRPQTGPTGGGDAKVDSETFPVASELELAWYTGSDSRAAASERWAFAFSAKKKWVPKVRSDIEKIANTQREYKRAFFVSNQFASDRNRSQEEDALSKKFGFKVTIFDRAWILDQVFTSNLQNLAIEFLKIDLPINDSVLLGYADVKRKSDLKELDEKIVEQVRIAAFGPALVDDCLYSAILARAIEVPEVELDGRFLRARSMADKHGTVRQQIEVAYQEAWTAYWWKEDYSGFGLLYSKIEKLVFASPSIDSLQLLDTLWFILFTISKLEVLDSDELQINAKTIALAGALTEISVREDLPNGSLRARSMLAVQQIAHTLPDPPESVFEQLRTIIQESDGLIGFPVEPLIASLTEVGQFFIGNSSYDRLFELMLDVTSTRSGEIAKGKMLLDRGIQLAAEDRFYEAIRVIGRCLNLFAKDESVDELILALFVSGHCYQSVGLFWAARGALFNSAELILRQFDVHADTSYLGTKCFDSLKWVELSLGRVGSVLLAHKLDILWRNNLSVGPIEFEPTQRDHTFDFALGILMLTASPEQLKLMEMLPDVLGRLALDGARDALLYALGHQGALSGIHEEESGSIHDFFLKWRHQLASDEIAPSPVFYNNRLAILTSQILGCEIVVHSSLEGNCLGFSESLLAVLEAILSTGMKESLFAMESRLILNVELDQAQVYPFAFTADDSDGIPRINVRLSQEIRVGMAREQQLVLNDKLCEIAVHIFLRGWGTSDLESVTSRLFGEQRALERALNISGNLMVTERIFGREPNKSLDNWRAEDDRTYSLMREEPWDSQGPENFDMKEWLSKGVKKPVVASDGEGLNQRSFKTRTPIRRVLWERAKWRGVGYFFGVGKTIPMMGILFENAEAGAAIFKGLVDDVGKENKNKELKITVVKGVLRSNPHAYRMMVGYNTDLLKGDGMFSMMTRTHTMEPDNDRNLDMFLKVFADCGSFILTWAVIPGNMTTPEPDYENMIYTDVLTVREAWSVGLNDPDMVAIHHGDDPIIPDGKDAPVLQVLDFLKSKIGNNND